jgi:hypothetical protein
MTWVNLGRAFKLLPVLSLATRATCIRLFLSKNKRGLEYARLVIWETRKDISLVSVYVSVGVLPNSRERDMKIQIGKYFIILTLALNTIQYQA